MSLHDELAAYLAQRRRLGFKLVTVEYLLAQFCGWLAARGKTDGFTVDDAVAWARAPRDAAPAWRSERLAALRPFAAYLNAIGADAPVIPKGLLKAPPARATPFIYTQADLDALMAACAQACGNERVAAMMRTIIGLLAATGLRIGEAVGLTVADIDAAGHLLFVRKGKTPLDRYVPVDPTTLDALSAYIDLPERRSLRPDPLGPIFVNHRGQGITAASIQQLFRRVATEAGLTARGRARPRLHDFRHTFATAHMASAYTRGGNPQRTLGLLATWLGHTNVADTYWYLSATPELMALAAARLEPHQGEPS